MVGRIGSGGGRQVLLIPVQESQGIFAMDLMIPLCLCAKKDRKPI